MITTSRLRTRTMADSLAASTLTLSPTPGLTQAAETVAEELLGGTAGTALTLAWEAGEYPELALKRRADARLVVDELGATTLQDAVDQALRSVRGLTIRQPWAAAITHLGKRVENRGRRTEYRGLLLLHAARDADEDLVAQARQADPGLPFYRQAVIASACLTGCHLATRTSDGTVCCAPWGDDVAGDDEPPVWHWEITRVREHAVPVHCSGTLGLWSPAENVLDSVIGLPGEDA